MVFSSTSEPLNVATKESPVNCNATLCCGVRNTPVTWTDASGGLSVPVPVTVLSVCAIANVRATVDVAPVQRPVSDTADARAKVTGTDTCIRGSVVSTVRLPVWTPDASPGTSTVTHAKAGAVSLVGATASQGTSTEAAHDTRPPLPPIASTMSAWAGGPIPPAKAVNVRAGGLTARCSGGSAKLRHAPRSRSPAARPLQADAPARP